MNRREVSLQRLFDAAKAAPVATAAEPMPGHLKTRILARSRSQGGALDLVVGMARVFRVGMGIALTIMVISLAWSYNDINRSAEDDMELATVQAHLDLEL